MKNTLKRALAFIIVTICVLSLSIPAYAKSEMSNHSKQYINIMDYGAAGDGVTDDSAAFQKALNAAQKNGLPLYLPAGTYNLNGQEMRASVCDLTVYGDGMDQTVIRGLNRFVCYYGITLRDFSIIDSCGYAFYSRPHADISISIQNVSYTGPEVYTDVSVFFYGELSSYVMTNVYIDNCYVTRANRAIFINSNIEKCTITNCTFENLGDRTADIASGIILGRDYTTTASNVRISKNTIQNLYTAYSENIDELSEYKRAYGILVYGKENIEISNNHLENIIGGIAHSGIYTKSPEAKILNNELINAGDGGGCIVNKCATTDTTDFLIKGNTIFVDQEPANETSSFNGILFKGSNVDIEDNKITLLTGGTNINIYQDAVKSVTIHNNYLEGTGRWILYLTSATSDVSVSNNVVRHNNLTDLSTPASFRISKAYAGSTFNFTSNDVQSANAPTFNCLGSESGSVINLVENNFSVSNYSGGATYYDMTVNNGN